jgi:hypothetical protein
MAQPQGPKTTAGGRLDGSVGTAVAGSDFELGAGWGADSTIAVAAGSTVHRGSATITTVVGAGAMDQATSTVAFTYPDGAFASAPVFLVDTQNTNAVNTGRFEQSACTTTAVTWVHSVLPVTAKTYTFRWVSVA